MKNLDYYNTFWYRFTKPIKRLWFKILLHFDRVIYVGENDRGVGKTYMTIEKAIKKNIPIIVGKQEVINIIKRDANSVEVLGLAPNFTHSVVGKDFPNGVLVDESLKPEMLEFLRENNIIIRGGFIKKEVSK